MTTIRVNHQKNYSVISNRPFNQNNLSWKAKGILAYLLTLPDNWEVKIAHLKSVSADGRDATANGIKELEQAGYIQKEKYREKGRIQYRYTISENPESTTLAVADLPERLSRNGSAGTVNPALISTNKESTKEKNTKEQNNSPLTPKGKEGGGNPQGKNSLQGSSPDHKAPSKDKTVTIHYLGENNALRAISSAEIDLDDFWLKLKDFKREQGCSEGKSEAIATASYKRIKAGSLTPSDKEWLAKFMQNELTNNKKAKDFQEMSNLLRDM